MYIIHIFQVSDLNLSAILNIVIYMSVIYAIQNRTKYDAVTIYNVLRNTNAITIYNILKNIFNKLLVSIETHIF